jgi:hypothetical protein
LRESDLTVILPNKAIIRLYGAAANALLDRGKPASVIRLHRK